MIDTHLDLRPNVSAGEKVADAERSSQELNEMRAKVRIQSLYSISNGFLSRVLEKDKIETFSRQCTADQGSVDDRTVKM